MGMLLEHSLDGGTQCTSAFAVDDAYLPKLLK